MKLFSKTLAGVLSLAVAMTTVPSAVMFASAAKPTDKTAKTVSSPAALTVDGTKDDIYSLADPIVSTYVQGESQLAAKEGFSATTYTAYYGKTLYFYTEVVDPDVVIIENPADLSAAKNGERIKYNLDFDNVQSDSATNDDIHGLNLNVVLSENPDYLYYNDGEDASKKVTNINDAVNVSYVLTNNGYNVELSLDTSKIAYIDGYNASIDPLDSIGLDVYVMDKQGTGGGNRALFTWSGGNTSWDRPGYNGTINLDYLSPPQTIAASETVNNGGQRGYYNAATKEFSTEDNGGDPVSYFTDSDINNNGEINWNGNFRYLDPNKTYILTAYMSFDLSEVDPNTPDDALVLGLGPCVYDEEREIGWWNEEEQKYDGSWGPGIYNYYLNGGIYTYGQIKALQQAADANGGTGYVRIQTKINSRTFQYDPADVTSYFRIQARIAGLKNVNAMKYMGTITEDFVAPAGLKVAFKNYELTLASSTAKLASVTVNNIPATINEEAKTVSVELPAGSNPSTAVVVATAEDGGVVVVNGNQITVTSMDDEHTAVYTLNITVKQSNPKNAIKDGVAYDGSGNPITGTKVAKVGSAYYAIVNGKVVTGTKVVKVGKSYYAIVNDKVVTGTKVAKVGKSSYAIVKDKVVTGTKVAKVGSSYYAIVKDKVVTGTKVAKVGKKYYAVKNGKVVYKSKASLATIGKYKFVVSPKGVVTVKKLVKVGKKTYVNKSTTKGIYKKQSFKIGKKKYVADKNGVVKKA